ncbi:nitrite reductase small subunit NirD [Halotalea alkalilenta]|uniref:Rieske domain-containing protein n=1 Tax=Halotalea alkalilenta TaxID=376489 RepID=A0A172YH77_9GAMM|nr:nitrite reductase small subunit NirD [Halotalea alkalilenta]ANF58557.1 hypothetical protein A5892_14635 [Halotalea alkalilenta]
MPLDRSEEAVDSECAGQWQRLCSIDELVPDAGVTAWCRGEQIALFLLPAGSELSIYALANGDPFSGANVIGRGIVGDIAAQPVVASPLYKQHFRLADGRCIESPEIALRTWPVRLRDGWVEIDMHS